MKLAYQWLQFYRLAPLTQKKQNQPVLELFYQRCAVPQHLKTNIKETVYNYFLCFN